MNPNVSLASLLLLLASQFGCEMPEMDQPAPIPVVKSTPAEKTKPVTTEPAEPREFTANDPKKGKQVRSVGGYAGAVFGARFWAEHQIIIDNIKHTLDLYNAEHGNYPKTHEEFMSKIIAANQITLPKLDAGQEYIYDPETHTLDVRASQASAETTEATTEGRTPPTPK